MQDSHDPDWASQTAERAFIGNVIDRTSRFPTCTIKTGWLGFSFSYFLFYFERDLFLCLDLLCFCIYSLFQCFCFISSSGSLNLFVCNLFTFDGLLNFHDHNIPRSSIHHSCWIISNMPPREAPCEATGPISTDFWCLYALIGSSVRSCRVKFGH